jgi:superfamily II DNA or RNA helicase
MTPFTRGDRVQSERFGSGRVELDTGQTVIVRFEHGIEECEAASLRRLLTPAQAIDLPEWHSPVDAVLRCLAEAVVSVNDAWGVFSRSRIALLPHQLWVCRQVIRSWPTRWLVADDVGLGKTIEAGLILLPLLARGDVRRLLILCPASLIEQWQERLRTMFDIRVARYTAEADTPKSDFWHTHPQVVASLQTLRLDRGGRWQRLLDAPPWDLVVIDEAHHLNADEDDGPTLGYRLLERLEMARRIVSLVFFTGTPHRGKDYGFLALLRLLRADLFDPRQPLRGQLPRLREVMIRNNKQNVTDLAGNCLFHPPLVHPETYRYSPAEARFYEMLTEFILTGKAYASTLASGEGRAVMLVLFAMQKLASSSVAAIRRALSGRLGRITAGRKKLEGLKDPQKRLAEYEELQDDYDEDAVNRLDEQIAELSAQLRLMEDEEPRLRELLAAAEAVTAETKVAKILSLLEASFTGRPVLLFTEYKATQSLLMSALNARFGDGCVTFINGDERADNVVEAAGQARTLYEPRALAAQKFNAGQVRFLVSTEAGGEGIDLQENCHSLIHVDLPWNPMRLHQRVGRLNRYGQTRQVEVFTVRNPETVESHIWDKLNQKFDSIDLAMRQVMAEPEDLLQLVLGMTSPRLFREVFAEAPGVPPEALSDWFDRKTTRFGGKEVLETVRDLVGHCARFDFQQVASEIPGLDLPDLKPFFTGMLEANHRKVRDDVEGLSFLAPESWARELGVQPSYREMAFDRGLRAPDAVQRVLGVGHKLVDQALAEARGSSACAALLLADALVRPLCVFLVTDRVTSSGGNVRSVAVGVEGLPGEEVCVLRDADLVRRLNDLLTDRALRRGHPAPSDADRASARACLEETIGVVRRELPRLDLPFRVPEVNSLAIFWTGLG